MSYHAQEGLHFTRQADGSVVVEKYTNDRERRLEMRVHLPASIWASAVTSVSREGETFETFTAALERQMPVQPQEQSRPCPPGSCWCF